LSFEDIKSARLVSREMAFGLERYFKERVGPSFFNSIFSEGAWKEKSVSLEKYAGDARRVNLHNCHLTKECVAFIVRTFPKLETLDISFSFPEKDGLEPLERCASLRAFIAQQTPIQALPAFYEKGRKIEHIDLSFCTEIPSEYFRKFPYFRNLRILSLSGTHLSTIYPLVLHRRQLRELSLASCSFFLLWNHDIDFPQLEALDLSSNGTILFPGFVRGCRETLRSLNLSDCESLSAEAFLQMPPLPQLQRLFLRGAKIDRLNPFLQSQDLREIDLSGTNIQSVNFAGNLLGFPALDRFAQLRKLIAKESEITLDNIRPLRDRLEVLDLSDNFWVFEEENKPFPQMPRLRELFLRNSALGRIKLRSLLNSKNIEVLDISGTERTKEEFAALQALEKLSTLCLEECETFPFDVLSKNRALTSLRIGRVPPECPNYRHIASLHQVEKLTIDGKPFSGHVGRKKIRKLFGVKKADNESGGEKALSF